MEIIPSSVRFRDIIPNNVGFGEIIASYGESIGNEHGKSNREKGS